jgi:hypothetical protein
VRVDVPNAQVLEHFGVAEDGGGPDDRCRDRQGSEQQRHRARQAQRAVVDHANHGGKDQQPSTEIKGRHVMPTAAAGGLSRPPQLCETLMSTARAQRRLDSLPEFLVGDDERVVGGSVRTAVPR